MAFVLRELGVRRHGCLCRDVSFWCSQKILVFWIRCSSINFLSVSRCQFLLTLSSLVIKVGGFDFVYFSANILSDTCTKCCQKLHLSVHILSISSLLSLFSSTHTSVFKPLFVSCLHLITAPRPPPCPLVFSVLSVLFLSYSSRFGEHYDSPFQSSRKLWLVSLLLHHIYPRTLLPKLPPTPPSLSLLLPFSTPLVLKTENTRKEQGTVMGRLVPSPANSSYAEVLTLQYLGIWPVWRENL